MVSAWKTVNRLKEFERVADRQTRTVNRGLVALIVLQLVLTPFALIAAWQSGYIAGQHSVPVRPEIEFPHAAAERLAREIINQEDK